MRRSFDLETHRIIPGLLAPPLVCGSTAYNAGGEYIAKLLTREQALATLREIIDSGDTVVGANIAYDMGVAANEDPSLLEPIFRAYAEGRVYDIQIAQALDAIANGHLGYDPKTGQKMINPSTGKVTDRYSLALCVWYTLGRNDAKAHDFWRLRYAILEGLPHEEWPEEARVYPLDDARNTLEVADVQIAADFRNLGNMPEQAETAFAMHLGAMWGIRTDGERVRALRERNEEAYGKLVERYKTFGFIRPDGSEDTCAVKRAVARAYGAEGTCSLCGGKGKRRKPKEAPCRGEKVKGRFQGCKADSAFDCAACGNTGKIVVLGNEVICNEGDGGCGGTGLDLETAPNLPRAYKGGISCSRDTLMESGDDDLHDYGDNECEKILKTYLPFLEAGIDRPINLRPNVLVASGRTSYEGLIQLIPRSGGVRDCFVARPGRVFCSVDYSALELCTLAQVTYWLFGHSEMRRIINESGDPGALHTAFAAKLVGTTFEDLKARIKAGDKVAKNYRQAAKPANFGFPGGMGAAKLVQTKRKRSEGTTYGADGRAYAGIRFCILVGGAEQCGVEKVTEWKRRPCPPLCKKCLEIVEYQIRPAWFEQYPEMPEYFEWVSGGVDTNGELLCFGPVDRVRGGLDFCSGANNGFQALAADGAKAAFRKFTRECYLDRESPLWGTRPIMFVHDEVFSEMPRETAHLAGPRKAKLMVEAMRKYVPDVHIAAEPALMEFWYKDAEPAYDEKGVLIPWHPKPKKSG